MQSIVVTGFPRQAAYLSNLLNAHVTGLRATAYANTRFAMLRAAAHALRAGASITVGDRPNGFVRTICEHRSRPAILLWVGSDVTTITQHPRELEPLRLQNLVHWACAPNLVGELEEVGIDARYVPIASAPLPKVPAPMPETFCVITYLPHPRRDFYGQQYIWQAAHALPDVNFVVVGPGNPEPDAPSNVRYAGEVSDTDAYLDAASVFVRLSSHDGLSHFVIQALARARHVIWTYPFPGVIHAASSDDGVDALIRLRNAHREGRLASNETGRDHVAQHYSPSAIAKGVASAVDDEIAKARTRSSGKRSKFRLALSGQEVLSARVAANFSSCSETIAGTVLTTATMSETVVSALQLARSDAWYTIYEPLAPKALELAATISGKRRIVHWLGDDVDVLTSDLALLRKFQSASFVHLAHDAAVASRLNDLGLRAKIVPLPAVAPVSSLPALPKVFTLLIYLPPNDPEDHRRKLYERLMRALRHEAIHYIFIGGGEIDVAAGVSAERISWRRDLTAMYDRSSAFIRLARAGCVSTMIIEALLRGRYVVCDDDVSFTTRVRDYAELEAAVRSLMQRHSDGALSPNSEAAAATSHAYAPERCLQIVEEACAQQR